MKFLHKLIMLNVEMEGTERGGKGPGAKKELGRKAMVCYREGKGEHQEKQRRLKVVHKTIS
jgi:hypothetical protein